jgi:hypothetical protein
LRTPAATSGAPYHIDESANHDDDGDHDGHDRDCGGGKDHGRESSERDCPTQGLFSVRATLDQRGSKGAAPSRNLRVSADAVGYV